MSGWQSWSLTHVGAVRQTNEDTFVDRSDIGLWAVADGAGGHEHGEVASNMLAEALGGMGKISGSDLVSEIRSAVSGIHQALRERADSESEATGAAVTIASTLAVFLASGVHYACLWAGDSRIYQLRAGALTQLTRDHSLVQILVDDGTLTEEEAEHHPHANVITRAIGADGADPSLDKVTGTAEPGDRYLLCSDGLNKALDHATIMRLTGADDPAQRLIDTALAHAVRDNVTVIVVAYQDRGAAWTAEDEDATLVRRPA